MPGTFRSAWHFPDQPIKKVRRTQESVTHRERSQCLALSEVPGTFLTAPTRRCDALKKVRRTRSVLSAWHFPGQPLKKGSSVPLATDDRQEAAANFPAVAYRRASRRHLWRYSPGQCAMVFVDGVAAGSLTGGSPSTRGAPVAGGRAGSRAAANPCHSVALLGPSPCCYITTIVPRETICQVDGVSARHLLVGVLKKVRRTGSALSARHFLKCLALFWPPPQEGATHSRKCDAPGALLVPGTFLASPSRKCDAPKVGPLTVDRNDAMRHNSGWMPRVQLRVTQRV